MRTSGKQSALHFLTMQRVQDIFEVHSCSALHWRAKGSSCNVANGSIASTSYSRTILGSDRLGHFEGVFTGTNRRPSWSLIEVDWECVLTWHFVVLGWCRPWGSEWMRISDPWRKSIGACWHEWLWAKHDWGWSRHICERHRGPPSWKNKRMDPGRAQILFSRLGSQQIHSCCQFAIYTPKLLLVCLHWELAGKTYEQWKKPWLFRLYRGFYEPIYGDF